MTASIAAAAIAAGRVALTMRAFSAESRGRMLLWLQGGAAMLVVASLVFRMVDAPSLASPDGVLSLIGYGLIGIAGAIASAVVVGVSLWHFAVQATRYPWAMPLVAGGCAAMPSVLGVVIAWSWVPGATDDPLWRLRLACGVLVPLAAGVGAMVRALSSPGRTPS